MNKYLKYTIMGIIAVALSALLFKPQPKEELPSTPRNYDEIIHSGILHAVTEYNYLSYYAQGDTIGGFHYELLQAFAKDKGLTVEITPEMSEEKRIEGVKKGLYDLLANNVLISNEREDSLKFTSPIILSRQILVQRKAESENDSTYINSLLDLANKTIHVVKHSPAILRIRNLSNEIGDTIYIQEVEKYGQEQLLAMVAGGDIDYAVCDENIALTNINGLPQLDIKTAISFTQFYSWGVNPSNTVFLDSLNTWLNAYKQTPEFQNLMKKYYIN